MENDEEVVFTELTQTAPTNLYFMDVRRLMQDTLEYVAQPGDARGPGTILYGCMGVVNRESEEFTAAVGTAEVMDVVETKHDPDTLVANERSAGDRPRSRREVRVSHKLTPYVCETVSRGATEGQAGAHDRHEVSGVAATYQHEPYVTVYDGLHDRARHAGEW